MARTRKFWGVEEFVNYEEYAYYGISGKAFERNMIASQKKGLTIDQTCPFCCKELKEGSYVVMKVVVAPNGVNQYYFNPNAVGKEIKVGLGCFRNLMKAYKDKYGKLH